jgi:transposase-like protein
MDEKIQHDTRLAYIDFSIFETLDRQGLYCYLRYLGALFPDANTAELAVIIKDVINASGVCKFSDLLATVRGSYIEMDERSQLSTMRFIIDRLSVNNPGHTNRSLSPMLIIQLIGKTLEAGNSYTRIAREIGVERHTVARIDSLTGITRRREAEIQAKLDAALANGTSSRVFSKEAGISKSQAHRLLKNGKLLDNATEGSTV